MTRSTLTSLLLLTAFAAPLAAQAPAPEPKPQQADQKQQIDDLIAKLKSTRYAEREAASKALGAMGAAAKSALEAAAKSDDLEQATRAKALLDALAPKAKAAPDKRDPRQGRRQRVIRPQVVRPAPAPQGKPEDKKALLAAAAKLDIKTTRRTVRGELSGSHRFYASNRELYFISYRTAKKQPITIVLRGMGGAARRASVMLRFDSEDALKKAHPQVHKMLVAGFALQGEEDKKRAKLEQERAKARAPLIRREQERAEARDYEKLLQRMRQMEKALEKLVARQKAQAEKPASISQGGTSAEPLSDALKLHSGVKQGALLSAVSPALAKRWDLRPHDIVTAVGKTAIDSPRRLFDALESQPITGLTIVRAGKQLSLTAKPEPKLVKPAVAKPGQPADKPQGR